MITLHSFLAQVVAPAATQAAATTAPTTEAPFPFNAPWFPVLLGVAIFYFILIRPQRNKDKERQKLMAALKRGDRVQTIGGILGTVVEAREDEVVLKLDESNNTKVKFVRSAIAKVLDEEKPAAAAADK